MAHSLQIPIVLLLLDNDIQKSNQLTLFEKLFVDIQYFSLAV